MVVIGIDAHKRTHTAAGSLGPQETPRGTPLADVTETHDAYLVEIGLPASPTEVTVKSPATSCTSPATSSR